MWTVFGSNGFVGKTLVEILRQRKEKVFTPTRKEVESGIRRKSLGKVVYCIGLTADFRDRPKDAVHAHVCVLLEILVQNQIESITYLSSTRVYAGANSTEEERALIVNPVNLSDLYNLSKLMGESLCLCSGIPAQIVRLSNVYGDEEYPNYTSPMFISSLLRECAEQRKLLLRTSPSSSKDYIHVKEAANLILSIAAQGKSKIYNVASGCNASNAEIAMVLQKCGIPVEFVSKASSIDFAPISINRIREEFFVPVHRLTDNIPSLLKAFQNHYSQ